MLKLQRVILFSFLVAGFARAERVEIFSDGKVINFFVRQGLQSMVQLPESIVQVITSYPEGTASYTVSDNKFFFLLSGPWEGLVFVLGESGQTYPLLVKEVQDNPDVCLRVRGKVSTFKMSLSSQMEEALKELLQGKTEKGVAEPIDTVFYSDKKIIIKGQRLFRFMNGFVGVEGEIGNVAKTQIVIPVTQIAIPKLVAISLEKEVLSSKEKTKVYLLFSGE